MKETMFTGEIPEKTCNQSCQLCQCFKALTSPPIFMSTCGSTSVTFSVSGSQSARCITVSAFFLSSILSVCILSRRLSSRRNARCLKS